METFEDYLDIADRRKWWIIITFLLVILAGLAYGLSAPRVYESETLILVQPQRVPEDFVRSIISSHVEDRLRTITQQVTSRTNLEKIISSYKLYYNPDGRPALHRKVGLMREHIKIDVGHRTGRRGTEANSFTISFQYNDPVTARDVTNILASNFIGENLRIRESQAIGTSEFISNELESVKRQLIEKEEGLKKYRKRYMGGLPEQLETNLSTLERLQTHLDQLNRNLMEAENRRIVIQAQIAEQEETNAELAVPTASGSQRPMNITSLRSELAFLESKYSQRHPDVIRMKQLIGKLEAEKAENGTDAVVEEPVLTGVDQVLPSQLQEIKLEINILRTEIPETQSQIKRLQAYVEETPKREQELLTINRDYENLQALYNSLLQRKLEAKIAVSMEKKQKGEQFRVIDAAKIPSAPIKPDLRRIMLITLVLGLGLGCGLAYLIETMDKSYKTPMEAEKELKLPILMSMPIHYSKKQLRNIKIKTGLTIVSVGIGFFLCATAIVLTIKGVDGTLNFVREFAGKVESRLPLEIINFLN